MWFAKEHACQFSLKLYVFLESTKLASIYLDGETS